MSSPRPASATCSGTRTGAGPSSRSALSALDLRRGRVVAVRLRARAAEVRPDLPDPGGLLVRDPGHARRRGRGGAQHPLPAPVQVAPADAVASVGVSQVIALALHLTLLAIFAALAGHVEEHRAQPPDWTYIALAVLVAAVLVVLAVPACRKLLLSRLATTLGQVIPRLLDVAQQPAKLAEGIGGALLVTAAYICCLAVSVRAFGGSLPIVGGRGGLPDRQRDRLGRPHAGRDRRGRGGAVRGPYRRRDCRAPPRSVRSCCSAPLRSGSRCRWAGPRSTTCSAAVPSDRPSRAGRAASRARASPPPARPRGAPGPRTWPAGRPPAGPAAPAGRGGHLAVRERHGALHPDRPAPQGPSRGAQPALRRRQRQRGSRREDRGQRDPAGLRRVGGQDGERAPGGRETEVGVDDPAEKLGVVGDNQPGRRS